MPLRFLVNWFPATVVFLIMGGWLFCHGNTAFASTTPHSDMWMTNGSVYSMVTDQTTLYIGGDFSYVGPSTGAGIGVDAITAGLVSDLPKVHGAVYAVVSDGANGWYIGGAFDNVGGVDRNNIAHIEADYSVDTTWDPDAGDAVYAMVLSGSTLYIGGAFTTVDSTGPAYLAALDINAIASPYFIGLNSDVDNGAVRSMTLSGKTPDTLYIGGDFTALNSGADTRNHIAELDLAGTLTGWDPDAGDVVRTMALSGTTLYVGGDFTSIDGDGLNHLAKLDTTASSPNIAITSWNPGSAGITTVNTLALSGTGALYVGGDFTTAATIGGQSRNYIAALSESSGSATSWNPNADGVILSMALSGKTPDTLFVGGDFTSINSNSRVRLAEINLQTGNTESWAISAEDKVRALAMSDDGAIVFAGGDFVSAGGQPRQNLAALDIQTGTVVTFNPDVDDIVRTMALTGDGETLYIGGDFSLVGAQARNYLAAVSATSANATLWDPNAGDIVRDIRLSNDDATLYVAGNFTGFNGGADVRLHIAAIETASDATITPWAPDADDIVRAITLSGDGTTLYAGGDFGIIGQQARSNLAALSTSSGAAIPGWAPSSSAVYAVQLSSDESVLYAGGINELSGFNVSDGAINSMFNGGFVVPNNGTIEAIALSSDDTMLYAGGSFSTFDGQPRDNIARYNLVEDPTFITAWNPGSDSAVHDLIFTDSDANLYVAGDFTLIGGDVRNGMAAIPMLPPDTTPTPAAGAYTIAQDVVLDCVDNSGTDCAETYYTVDDSTPTVSSTKYSLANPINIPSGTVTVKYFSVDDEGSYEGVKTSTFVIDSIAPTTTASPGSGTYNAGSNPITLTCIDVGGSGCSATYYSIDGSTPTASSTEYTGPIPLASLEGTFSLKFISFDNAGNEEAVVNSIDYTVDITPPTTTISHASGTYAPPQTIILICDDGDGSGCDEIYYTTDLTAPTTQSTKYSVTGPLTVSSGTVVRAVAIDGAGNLGNEVVGIYAFTIGAGESKSGVGSVNPALLLVILTGFVLCGRRGTRF